MFIWLILDKLTKFTTGTDADDKLVQDLQAFFQASPVLRKNILSVLWRGVQNGFDFDDEAWTNDVLALVFEVIRTQASDDGTLIK